MCKFHSYVKLTKRPRPAGEFSFLRPSLRTNDDYQRAFEAAIAKAQDPRSDRNPAQFRGGENGSQNHNAG